VKTTILIAVLAFAFSQTDTNVIVEGIVTETGTSTPLPGVQIRLTSTRSSGSPPGPLRARTAANGRFQISAPPGEYTIAWQREGTFDPLNDGVPDSKSKLTLVAGKAETPMNLSLTTGGVITGLVSNPDGSPASRVTVTAMQLSFGSRGERITRVVESEETNERGEYRLYWIPPGSYIVGFTPSVLGATQTLTSSSGPPRIRVRTYYPGASDLSKAERINVAPHSETSGINFSLRDAEVFNVSGRATYPFVAPPPGQASSLNQNPSVVVMAAEPGAQRFAFIPSAPGNAPQGTFELRGIPAGHYNLLATVGPPAGAILYAGEISIDISNHDLKDVTLNLLPPLEVPGRVAVPQGVIPPELYIPPADGMTPVGPTQIKPAADGQFTFKGASGGSFLLEPHAAPELYVVDLKVGERSFYEDLTFRLSESNEPIQIVFATSAATVSGTIVWTDGQKKMKTAAVLVPDAPRRRSYFVYRQGNADESDQFKIVGVPPGNYRLFASDLISVNGWRNADIVSKHENMGIPVVVTANSNLTGLQVPVVDLGQ
jgi:hypothetical protein